MIAATPSRASAALEPVRGQAFRGCRLDTNRQPGRKSIFSRRPTEEQKQKTKKKNVHSDTTVSGASAAFSETLKQQGHQKTRTDLASDHSITWTGPILSLPQRRGSLLNERFPSRRPLSRDTPVLRTGTFGSIKTSLSLWAMRKRFRKTHCHYGDLLGVVYFSNTMFFGHESILPPSDRRVQSREVLPEHPTCPSLEFTWPPRDKQLMSQGMKRADTHTPTHSTCDAREARTLPHTVVSPPGDVTTGWDLVRAWS